MLGKQYLNSGASGKSHSKGYDEVDDMSGEGWKQAAETFAQAFPIDLQAAARTVKIHSRYLLGRHIGQSPADGRLEALVSKEQWIETDRLKPLYGIADGCPVRFGRTAVCY